MPRGVPGSGAVRTGTTARTASIGGSSNYGDLSLRFAGMDWVPKQHRATASGGNVGGRKRTQTAAAGSGAATPAQASGGAVKRKPGRPARSQTGQQQT